MPDEGLHFTREKVAAALCDATNRISIWDSLSPEGRAVWLHRADDFVRELAKRDIVCVTIAELEGAWNSGREG